MPATFAYASARILLLVVSVILLYLVGARGLLLLALAFVVSGIASFVLLSGQRDRISRASWPRGSGAARPDGAIPREDRRRRTRRGRRLGVVDEAPVQAAGHAAWIETGHASCRAM